MLRDLDDERRRAPVESVRLVAFDPDGEARVLEAIVFANSTISHDEAAKRVAVMSDAERARSASRLTSANARTDATARAVPSSARTTASRS